MKDILKSLQIGKSSGGDFISHQMLKDTADTEYLPLTYIWNHSLRVSKYSSCWKIANVLSLFKKGDKSIALNYRPIALLSCVGKVFERIVFKYIYNYMLEHKLLYKFQSGFVSGHSTSHHMGVASLFCSASNHTLERGSFFLLGVFMGKLNT